MAILSGKRILAFFNRPVELALDLYQNLPLIFLEAFHEVVVIARIFNKGELVLLLGIFQQYFLLIENRGAGHTKQYVILNKIIYL